MVRAGQGVTFRARFLPAPAEQFVESLTRRVFESTRFFEATMTTLFHRPLPLGERPLIRETHGYSERHPMAFPQPLPIRFVRDGYGSRLLGAYSPRVAAHG